MHIEKKLDENNTITLQAILNKYWKQHPRNNSSTVTYFPF